MGGGMTAGAAGAYCDSLEWAPESVCPFFGVSFFGGTPRGGVNIFLKVRRFVNNSLLLFCLYMAKRGRVGAFLIGGPAPL